MRGYTTPLSGVKRPRGRTPNLTAAPPPGNALQGADTPSLRLLEFLTRTVADLGLLLVGTFRDEALEPGRPLAAALGQTIARKLAASTPARAAWPTPTTRSPPTTLP